MSDVSIEKPITLDLLATQAPSLSSTNDMPVVETKPDATNEGRPPEQKPEEKNPEAEAAPDEGKKPAESASVETPEEDATANTEGEGKPKPKGVQKRIDELVKQREDAERRADAEKAEKLRLLALVEKGGKPEAKPEEEPQLVRPSRAQFESDDAYENALDGYIEAKSSATAQREIQKTIAEQRQKAEREAIEQGQREAQAAYKTRVEKVVEKYPDYREVAESPDVQVSMPMAHAIVASEYGPDIQYFLGKNPAEAKRIANLNPALQLVELGLIVAKIQAPAAEPKPEAKPAKPAVSAAPKPIKPLEAGSDAQARKSPDDESMDEYAARRKREMASEARPGVRH